MQYTKPMIELVFEIRRRVNSNTKPGVKLANPDLLTELSDIYRDSKDTILRTLIKELMQLAGGDWPASLNRQNTESGAYSVRVYRGQTALQPKSSAESNDKSDSPARYYRGVKMA